MSLLEILLSGPVLFGLLLYAGAVVLVEWMAAQIRARDPEHGHILADRFLLPLGRAAAMGIFILAAYPPLFGTAEAPPLNTLLSTGSGRLNRLISLSLLLTLALPLVPIVGRRPVILPIQGMLLAAVVFSWAAPPLGIPEISYWPGMGVLTAMALFSVLAPFSASRMAHHIGGRLDRLSERHGFQDLVYDGLLMGMQLPSIVLYTHALGSQLGR